MLDGLLPPNGVAAFLLLTLQLLSLRFYASLFSLLYFFPHLNLCGLLSVTCSKLHMLSYSYWKIKRLVAKDNRFVVARCFGFMCCVTAFLENAQYVYPQFEMTSLINSSSCQQGYVCNDIIVVSTVMALDHWNLYSVYSFTVKGSQGFLFNKVQNHERGNQKPLN